MNSVYLIGILFISFTLINLSTSTSINIYPLGNDYCNNVNDCCGNETNPCRSIAYAIDLIKQNNTGHGTIILGNGTYYAQNNSGIEIPINIFNLTIQSKSTNYTPTINLNNNWGRTGEVKFMSLNPFTRSLVVIGIAFEQFQLSFLDLRYINTSMISSPFSADSVIFENCTFKNSNARLIYISPQTSQLILKNCSFSSVTIFGSRYNSLFPTIQVGTYKIVGTVCTSVFIENLYLDNDNIIDNDGPFLYVSGAIEMYLNNSVFTNTYAKFAPIFLDPIFNKSSSHFRDYPSSESISLKKKRQQTTPSYFQKFRKFFNGDDLNEFDNENFLNADEINVNVDNHNQNDNHNDIHDDNHNHFENDNENHVEGNDIENDNDKKFDNDNDKKKKKIFDFDEKYDDGVDNIVYNSFSSAFDTVYQVNVENCSFINLSARVIGRPSGSALDIRAGFTNFIVKNCFFYSNNLSQAINVDLWQPSNGTFLNCNFTSNACNTTDNIVEAGAINFQENVGNCNILFQNCVFEENCALNSGGSITSSLNKESTTTFKNCTFVNNESRFNGGHISASGGIFYIHETTFTNGTSNKGGAISMIKSELHISNTIMTGNQAPLGSSLYCERSKTYVDELTVFGDNGHGSVFCYFCTLFNSTACQFWNTFTILLLTFILLSIVLGVLIYFFVVYIKKRRANKLLVDSEEVVGLINDETHDDDDK